MTQDRQRRGGKALTAALAAVACASVWAQSSSPSFVLQRFTLNSAGQTSFAPSIRLKYSLGRDAAVGVSADDTFILQSGFWSFVASGPVPIVLAVARDPNTEDACQLRWSGNDPPYEIYLAQDCASVFDSLYETTSDNTLSDVEPAPSGLTCFNVVSMTSPP